MLDQQLYWLNSITPDCRHHVGDKAFYLGSSFQYGHPIIPGVVVSTAVFRHFIQNVSWNDPLLEDFPNSRLYIDVDQPRHLQSIAKQIRQAITTSPLPSEWKTVFAQTSQSLQSTYLICRPSISVASLNAPFLSSKIHGLLTPHYCRAEPDAIAQAIKQTWAEAFRAKSLFVWQYANISLQSLEIGVLIQPIYPSLASGTVQRRGNRLDIEACWGLGLAMKTGEVIPDRYSINLESGAIDAQTLGHQSYAYGRSGDECPESWRFIPSIGQLESNPLDAQMTVGSSVLLHYEVTHSHQQTAVLSPSALSTLATLYQSLVKDLDLELALEWVLGASPAAFERSSSQSPLQHHLLAAPLESLDTQQAWLYLTQVIPQADAPGSLSPLSQSPYSVPSPEVAPESKRPHTLPSALATPVITALGAAPGQVIAPVWVADEWPDQSVEQLPTGYILVAADITPDWMLDIKRAVALVSERGGMTCHAAIVARELRMPAVVGAEQVTRLLKTGDKVLVNGDRGTIHRVDSGFDPVLALGLDASNEAIAQSSTSQSHLIEPENAQDPHPHRTQLMVSVSQVESLSQLRTLPIDGIGLLRGELLLPTVLNRQPLDAWVQSGRTDDFIHEWSDRLRAFLEAVYPRPVYYRTADLRPQEFAELIGPPPSEKHSSHRTSEPAVEHNPLLGNHGTLSYLQQSRLFELELAGLYQLRQVGYENVHVMLPFVRTVEEFVACRQFIREANLLDFPDFQVWIMAEVPSVLFLLPEYVEAGISGIAIGTNDLTQLMLAMDRNQSSFTHGLDPRHPAVMRAIKQLVNTAQHLSIPCSICGEAPSQYPELIQQFVAWGVTSLSVSPSALEATYRAIAQAERSLLSNS